SQFDIHSNKLSGKCLSFCFESNYVASAKQTGVLGPRSGRLKNAEKRPVAEWIYEHEVLPCFVNLLADCHESIPLRVFWKEHFPYLCIRNNEFALLEIPSNILQPILQPRLKILEFRHMHQLFHVR